MQITYESLKRYIEEKKEKIRKNDMIIFIAIFFFLGFFLGFFIDISMKIHLFACDKKINKKIDELNVTHNNNFSKKDISSFIDKRASTQGIDPKIIHAIIQTESANNLYAIGVVAKDAKLIYDFLITPENKNKINAKYANDNKRISIMPSSLEIADELYDLLNKNKKKLNIYTIDYGLMQINHDVLENYGLEQKDIYLNPYYNIAVGVDILKTCSLLFPSLDKDAIECYNKGTDKSKFSTYDYYKAFLGNYKKMYLAN